MVENSHPPFGLVKDSSHSASKTRKAVHRFLPTFVGIGSMRCGSTWLYEVLKCHPDIRMSDAKEMDFFFMQQMLQYDLNWYAAHFKAKDGEEARPICGEISPLYARLKAWQVNRIAQMLPDLRIVLTLRHPIERAWSQAVYEFGHVDKRDVRTIGCLEFLRQVERARNQLSSDYCRTIKIWSDAFGRRALHIDFFDRLQDDPDNYVNDVLRHIGATTPWPVPEKFIKKKIWSTNNLVPQEHEIPEVVRWYLADRLLEPTERLNRLLEGRVASWVKEMRTIRGKTRVNWLILKEVNRALLSIPERVAYEAYHVALDCRLWLRWRQFQQFDGSSD